MQDDSRFLVVSNSIADQLPKLRPPSTRARQRDGTSADSLRVISVSQKSMYTADWKLQSRRRRSALWLRFRLAATFASSVHFCSWLLATMRSLTSQGLREIFPGGTKVDAGPPNLFGHQTCANFFIPIFCQNLGEDQKKKSSLKFSPIFCPKLGEDQKKNKRKKVFTEI